MDQMTQGQMSGGEALVRSLLAHGVDTVFGLPGIQLDHLFNAFHDHSNELRVIHPRHEQAAAYMATGYAQVSGRPGIYAVVPGPGFLNTTAALATAYALGAPVFCVTGQIHSAFLGKGVGELHEIPDQIGTMRGLTKWAARADHPTQIPALMRDGFKALKSGRPQPVGIEVPLDILAMRTEVTMAPPAAAEAPPPVDPVALEKAVELLKGAKNPMIFYGGGAVEAGPEIQALAQLLQAPVVPSRNSFGLISDREPYVQKIHGAHEMWKTADVVLAIGTRLVPQITLWGFDEDIKLIRLDIDPVEVNRVRKPDVSLLADAKAGTRALIDGLGALDRPSRVEEFKAMRAKSRAFCLEKFGPQMAYLDACREALPDDGILVEELTQVGYIGRAGFDAYHTRSYVTSTYQGTLGFGFATALGCKVGAPDKPVLCISGDGGLLYTIQELSTAVQQNLNVVTVVFSDGAYGNVRRMQIYDHGNRTIATNLHNPDFVQMAESFGATGRRAHGPEEMVKEIKAGFERSGPTLIDVPVELAGFPDPWPHLRLGKVRG